MDVPWMWILVRGKEISITPPEIARYYDFPFYVSDFIQQIDLMYFPRENMDNVINLLTDGKDEWKRHLGVDFPMSFSHEKLTSKARMWLKFINTQFCPASNMSNIDTFQATLLYAILKKERICVGTWIYWSMLQCTRKNEDQLLFPHLVIVLCRQEKVQTRQPGRFLQPTKFPILEPSVEYLIGHKK